MQRVSVTFWPTDNNTMDGVTLDIQVAGMTGASDQWARDLGDAIAPVIPAEALGWTAPAKVHSITIQDDSRGIDPNEGD